MSALLAIAGHVVNTRYVVAWDYDEDAGAGVLTLAAGDQGGDPVRLELDQYDAYALNLVLRNQAIDVITAGCDLMTGVQPARHGSALEIDQLRIRAERTRRAERQLQGVA